MEKRVYAYVVADLLHIGHIIALENAKSFGDKLIVGVLTDKATIEEKEKPILSFGERIRLIKSLKCVDTVVAQETYSPIDNVKKLKPDILMESDSHSKEYLEETIKEANSFGCKVIVTPYYKKQSSSKIKDKIKIHWVPRNNQNVKGGMNK
jgi:cytidyltransferase-like protein